MQQAEHVLYRCHILTQLLAVSISDGIGDGAFRAALLMQIALASHQCLTETE